MSVNGFVLNVINDLKVTINFTGGRKRRHPSDGNPIRAFIALGLVVCLILIVIGFGIAGATSGIENVPPLIKTVYHSLVGTGISMAIPLAFAYIVMGGGQP